MGESIVNDKRWCIVCGSPYVEKHHIFGGTRNRTNSDQDGLWVWICRTHHEETHRGGALMDYLHNRGQRAYEETHTRKEFMERYGKNYL